MQRRRAGQHLVVVLLELGPDHVELGLHLLDAHRVLALVGEVAPLPERQRAALLAGVRVAQLRLLLEALNEVPAALGVVMADGLAHALQRVDLDVQVPALGRLGVHAEGLRREVDLVLQQVRRAAGFLDVEEVVGRVERLVLPLRGLPRLEVSLEA